ncbi:beta-lactamase-like protein [Exophiala viscosa]|uniref:Beta-lactamase-like protein n=1 Tax=Exophiala viscosa TaxID=2486360 RepID=A0AAN6IA84_9EURO|nr:beta-lactamase-like protein [Exophiala viscosa]KAI1620347.1 beta-lactamase-like protein [Exophiala viscosa]
MAQHLPKLADWEQVSTNVVRILGGNPSKFTLQGTNTYLLGQGSERLLIDTGEGKKQWTDTLRTVLDVHKAKVSTCILTHWHHDHVGGVKSLESLGPIKVYKAQPTLNPDGILDPDRVHEISNGQRFSTTSTDGKPFEIEAVHTPGHAKDHMCFLVTSSPDPSEVGSLFTADNVLGHGTAVFEDLAAYLDSLHLMKSRAKGKAYPGHGAVIEDATAKIDEYIAHRRMREEEALNVLRYGTVKPPGTSSATHDSITSYGESDSETEKPAGLGKEVTVGKEWASMEMVKVIYRHYPESLYQPAEYGVLMVLEKLKKDGKVVKTESGKWRVSEKATL